MKLEEKKLSSEEIFDGVAIHLFKDEILLPNGNKGVREVIRHPGAVCVLPFTEDGQVVFVNQFRYALNKVTLEVPAGKLEKGEDPMEAAKRELYEETGFGGGEWSHFMTISPNAGACTNYSHTFLAIGVEPLSTQHLEESEDIKIVLMEPDEVIRMLRNDEFHQAMMAAPLWKYLAINKLL